MHEQAKEVSSIEMSRNTSHKDLNIIKVLRKKSPFKNNTMNLQIRDQKSFEPSIKEEDKTNQSINNYINSNYPRLESNITLSQNNEM